MAEAMKPVEPEDPERPQDSDIVTESILQSFDDDADASRQGKVARFKGGKVVRFRTRSRGY